MASAGRSSFPSRTSSPPAVHGDRRGIRCRQRSEVVEVWIGYRESMTRGPRPGFENCDDPSAFARVAESYRVEVGRRSTVAAQREPNRDRRPQHGCGAGTEGIRYRSHPNWWTRACRTQIFPAGGDTAHWLVPIGVVRWEPGNPGHFVARDAAALAAIRVAASTAAWPRVQSKRPAATSTCMTAKEYAPVTDELLWVEGDLRVDGDARIYGHRLQFARSHTEAPIAPFHLLRQDDAATGVKVQVVIGDESAGANRFAVGRQTSAATATAAETDAEALVVTDQGNVGIGTSTPKARLHLTEDGLQIGTERDAGRQLLHPVEY